MGYMMRYGPAFQMNSTYRYMQYSFLSWRFFACDAE